MAMVSIRVDDVVTRRWLVVGVEDSTGAFVNEWELSPFGDATVPETR
jgi:hypothetical protein